MKIKIIRAEDGDNMENKVNEFLKKEGDNVVDIKFSTDENDLFDRVSVMIILKK